MTYSIPDAVLAHHTALLGKTGSGKTSTGKLLIEQVAGQGFRVCILDTIKSDWWGVISSADGEEPGLPFRILGGPHGHVALPSSAGAAIGRLVGSGKLPLSIIDMADFEMGGVQRFFVDFAEALMRSQKGVLYLVIEEAHEVAPKERAGFGAENMAIHWAKKLATAGRSKGIRLLVATQRVQSLHNAVLGSCETLIAHRLTTPADQAPVIKWVKANVPEKEVQRQVSESLSSLPTGTGWLCSGEAQIFERVAFPKFATFDNTAAPMADDEEVKIKTAQVDQDELRAIIGDSVKEAEANDPKTLKARIAELEKRGGEPSWPDQREEVAGLKARVVNLEQERNLVLGGRDKMIALVADSYDRLRIILEAAAAPPAVKVEPAPEPFTEHVDRTVIRGQTVDEAYLLPEKAQEGPNAAAMTIAGLLKGTLNREADWGELLIMGGFRPGSGWIRKAYKSLIEHGFITPHGNGLVRSTAKLEAEVAAISRPTPAELRSLWADKLRGPGGQMAKWLAEHGPATREQIAAGVGMSATAGWSRKGFKDMIGSRLAHVEGTKLIPHPLLVDSRG